MTMDAVVSEEILRNLFSHYGSVFDCAIKKVRRDPVSSFSTLNGAVPVETYSYYVCSKIEN
jgi:hypothetical protein